MPDNAPQPLRLEGPEPVDQELMVPVAEVGDGLQHVGEHRVRGLGREYRVEEQDEESSHIVLPVMEIYITFTGPNIRLDKNFSLKRKN